MLRNFLSRQTPQWPIAGSQSGATPAVPPHEETFKIRVKEILGECRQTDFVDILIPIPPELPAAVAIEDCRVTNVVVESSIPAPDRVAVRARFDVVVTYRDAAGAFHVVTQSVAFPPDTEPPKIVVLIGADPTIHQVVVELTAFCFLTTILDNGRTIQVCVQLDWVIKFGLEIQIRVKGTRVTEHPPCVKPPLPLCPAPTDPTRSRRGS